VKFDGAARGFCESEIKRLRLLDKRKQLFKS